MDELTFTLHHPLTDEEWDAIVDADLEQTYEITFHTKNGKKVDFVKKPHWIPCSERLPEEGREVICQCRAGIVKVLKLDRDGDWYQDKDHVYMQGFVIAWQPLPSPYQTEEETGK